MATKKEKKVDRCPRCGLPAAERDLQVCMICRSLFCQECAVRDYGRQFCSLRCRGFFFYGDGDETEKDF
ncbi:MAG: hypothetical protein P8Y93_00815 [Acidobacteriota bacterium]|jgi:hypothetical protein